MLSIHKIDHVGIRVREKVRAVTFYEQLGFEVVAEGIFEQGHPIIMQHPSGVVINVLGPSTEPDGPNVLMDAENKPSGYTHMALHVNSIDETKAFFDNIGVPITGSIAFKGLKAIFVRDPDNNVIEFDEYEGDNPDTRKPIPHHH